MIRFLRAAVLALMLVPSTGTAQDFDAGLAAYEAGDFATALREWKPLAEQGNAVAQTNLGLMYANGQGVLQNYAEATKWTLLAAAQGDSDAQFNIGLTYYHGQGVPKDDAEAVKWFRLAAEQDHAMAQFNLGFVYDKGLGVPQDDAEALKWYRLAAQQGIAVAQSHLGAMYYQGRGVPQDFGTAYMWFSLGATNGNTNAAIVRDALGPELTPADLSEAQRRAQVCLASTYQGCD